MADTHPNAYLAEAADKRSQAAGLIQEAKSLEQQARDLGAEVPRYDEDKESEEPTSTEKPSADEVAESAAAEDEGKSYDEDDAHRHGKKRK